MHPHTTLSVGHAMWRRRAPVALAGAAAIMLMAALSPAYVAAFLAHDTPYTEYIPMRFVDASTPASGRVEGWGVLPTSGIQHVVRGAAAPSASSPPVAQLNTSAGKLHRTLTQAASGVRTYVLSADGVFAADWSQGAVAAALSKVNFSGSVTLPAAGGRLVTDPSGALVALAGPDALLHLSCTDAQAKGGLVVQCSVTSSAPGSFGAVNDAVYAEDGQVWIAAKAGLFSVAAGSTSAVNALPGDADAADMTAVAWFGGEHLLAAGNSAKIWFFTTMTTTTTSIAATTTAAGKARVAAATLTRWEWVTDVSNGAGAPVDDAITSLAFDANGVLYIGNPTCLNIRQLNNSFSRISGLQGLPYNNITSIDVQADADGSNGVAAIVWIGTRMGFIRYDTGGDPALLGDAFQYFYGPRYHAGTVITSLATTISAAPVPEPGAMLGTPSSETKTSTVVVVATDEGLTAMATQPWTLEQKAEYMDVVRQRHDRHGLIAECSLASFGNLSSCTNGASDNNGLWTSLVVGAECFRYAVTGDAEAQLAATHHFNAMKYLNDLTGIKGLFGRSFILEGQPTGGGTWHNSTVFPGWEWKGDTSSDEVVGHMFAYPLVARLLDNTTAKAEAVTLMNNIMTYIVKNGYVLIDVTGKPTTWGRWNPAMLNHQRNWSDERGVNANQVLAFLSAAYNATGDDMFTQAYAELTNATNQYAENTLNLKIEAPCDDNYSDDELTFLPYYTALTTSENEQWLGPVKASMHRTFTAIESLRSNLWGSIYLATMGYSNATVVEDIMWNLRTWSLELIEWPATNSHRLDIEFDPEADRFGRSKNDNVRVLPAHERDQLRWNGNPHDLDGGSGMSEGDPGAWLLPYWMARYHGIVGPPTV